MKPSIWICFESFDLALGVKTSKVKTLKETYVYTKTDVLYLIKKYKRE
jgi:hypothetical protein